MVITTLNIVNMSHFTFLIFYLFYFTDFTILRHVLKNISNYININVFLAPPTQRFSSSRCWVGGVFKVHSLVRTGLQGGE